MINKHFATATRSLRHSFQLSNMAVLSYLIDMLSRVLIMQSELSRFEERSDLNEKMKAGNFVDTT